MSALGRYSDALDRRAEIQRWLSTPIGTLLLRHQEQRLKQSGSSTDIRLWASIVTQGLDKGEAFWCSSGVCRLVEIGAASLPDWTLIAEHLPTRHGFCMFERPLPLESWGQERSDLALLTWETTDLIHPNGDTRRGVHVVFYVDGLWRDVTPAAPVTLFPWVFGGTMHQTFEDYVALAGEIDSRERFRQKVHYFAALMAFLDQRLLVTSRERSDRATRRRLIAAGGDEDEAVLVVRLRRADVARAGHTEAEHRDWAYRWLVSGHWRQQWLPSLNAHQPRWIAPYIKGPENKPLKPPTERVFAVVR